MTVKTPCEQGDPDDWFIERDGKQYRDDELVSLDDVDMALSFLPEGDETTPEEMAAKLAAEAKRQALIRRRKAREACYTCPARLRCLALGMQPENLDYGTWGGYYAEERQEIARLIAAREAAKAAAQEE